MSSFPPAQFPRSVLKRAVRKRPLASAYPRSPAALAFGACANKLLNLSAEKQNSGVVFFLEQLLESAPAA